MMSMMGWNMGFLGMIFWIIILGLVIYGVFLLISKPFEKKQAESDSSLRLLNERFARGEIDEEQYRRKKSILEE